MRFARTIAPTGSWKCRAWVWVLVGWVGWGVMGQTWGAEGTELRFPPPDFETHVMPLTEYPAARAQGWQWVDVGVLIGCLVLATWLVYGRRSRTGVVWLSVFSLAYFGFFRQGCVCAIGSVQNVALAWGGNDYRLPVGVAIFFGAPLLTALFFGRTFCSAVCPHGALQDLVLVKPVRVPRWLESGLGVVPYLFLGAGVIFAATGASFVICRFDPIVPVFRGSGGMGMVITGGVLLAVGLFVGRPYCRFLCPYGALLRLASSLSRWRVRITPDVCTQCQLCRESCPYGVIREPDAGLKKPAEVRTVRQQVWRYLVILPVLIGLGMLAGGGFGKVAARWHPTVDLAERFAAASLGTGVPPATLAERVALERAERQARELVPQALALKERFGRAGIWFGAWCGLVIGVRLLSVGMVRRRTEFEPDRGACLTCARCFSSCPQERIRRGLAPQPETTVAPACLHTAERPSVTAKGGGAGMGGGE